jgi:uncharacterized protein YbbC (DUF1343 family)
LRRLKAARDLYTEEFEWKNPPYEYVHDRNPFDVISGGDKLRHALEGNLTLDEISSSWQDGLKVFKQQRNKYLLY